MSPGNRLWLWAGALGPHFAQTGAGKGVIVENLEPLQCHGGHLDVTQMLLSTLLATRKI